MHRKCCFHTLNPKGLYQSLAPPVWAKPPPLTHNDNHTHTQGTWSYDAFYGIGGMHRLNTSMFLKHKEARVICVTVVLLRGTGF